MIKITIEKINEFEKTVVVYHDPQTSKQYDSKYDADDDVRPRLVSKEIMTGKKDSEYKTIYEQTISSTAEDTVIQNIIKAVNQI